MYVLGGYVNVGVSRCSSPNHVQKGSSRIFRKGVCVGVSDSGALHTYCTFVSHDWGFQGCSKNGCVMGVLHMAWGMAKSCAISVATGVHNSVWLRLLS